MNKITLKRLYWSLALLAALALTLGAGMRWDAVGWS